MSKYWEISGYWKDDKEEFCGYIVKEFDECIDGVDDDIFFYGMSERALASSHEDDALDFVVTDYREIEVYNDTPPTCVVILQTGDEGWWAIYEESGQCLEADFETEELAIGWAEDNGLEVVDSFNIK